MSTPTPSGTEAQQPPLYFQVPEGFYDIPLDASSAEEWDHRVVELTGRIWPGGTEFQRDMTAAVYAGLAEDLAREGIDYAGLALVDMEGRLSMGTLLVYVREMANPSPDVTAESVAEMLSAEDPDRAVDMLSLPCGPAVLTAEGLEAELSSAAGEASAEPEGAGETGEGNHRGADTRAASSGNTSEPDEPEEPKSAYLAQVRTWIPFPSTPHVAVFILSTPNPQDFDFYLQLLSRVTDTVTFTEPEWAREPSDA